MHNLYFDIKLAYSIYKKLEFYIFVNIFYQIKQCPMNLKNSILLVTFISTLLFSCTTESEKQNEDNFIEETHTPFKLGDSSIIFRTFIAGDSKIIYFNLHDDENTAVEAAKQILDKTDSRLIEIHESDKRLISFNIDTTVYKFDPNRIFTPLGRKKTLERYSQFSQEADSLVKSFADYITDSLLRGATIIVALHNNSPENYSILSYAKGGEYETDAAAVYVNEKQDPDDFFYVTEQFYFDKIKEKSYNVLLQDNSKVTDDGSLSVYCGSKGIKYINVEAEQGHLKQQVEMILALQDIL